MTESRAGITRQLVRMENQRWPLSVQPCHWRGHRRRIAIHPEAVVSRNQEFRDSSGPLIRQADFDAKVRCEMPRLPPAELARDNPVYPTVITPAARHPQSALWMARGPDS